MNSKNSTVSGNSERSFTLHWTARAGEHSYTAKLYKLVNGQKQWADLWSGKIRVRRPDQRFAVSLEVFPRELDGGGTVYFMVHVVNFMSTAISLSGFVEDEDGAVIKRIDGLKGRIPANGEKNISFSYTIYGVGNHTFKLFLDNSDGKPNSIGEEHWAEARVEVKPVGNVIASMECMDSVIPYDGSTTCEVTLLNTGNDSVSVSVTSVDFGTVHNAWAKSYQRGIEVKPIKITLPPHHDKEIDVKIDLRKLDQDFWGSDHFTYKFAEHTSYQVTVHLDNGINVSDVLTILNKPLELSKVGVLCSIVGGIGAGFATGANPAAAVAGAGLGYALGASLEKLYWGLYLIAHGN